MISYSDFRNDILNNKTTTVDFVKSIFNTIEEKKHLNAFISLNYDNALTQAADSDKRFSDGNPRIAEGLIVAVKDNISVKGLKMTCASKILENYEAVYDATVVKKLKDAGAIIIGKCNLDEFAMGSSNESSYFGKVLNPLNENFVPGGSSGGSAVAVAASFCHISLGSETGGSVRQPASFTGLYGIKPSYGRVSRYGLTAFGSSLDQVGIFSSNLEDLSLALDILSGKDEYDSTTIDEKPLDSLTYLKNLDSNEEIKIGVVGEELLKHSDFDVLEIYQNAVAKLEKAGHKIVEIDFPYSSVWIPTYYIIATAEASSNLSRFDGVRFGFRAEVEEGEDLIKLTRSQGFGAEVKRRILLGTYVLSEGHHDAFYLKALKARRVIFNNYKKIFKEVDTVFMPTTPSCAFKFNSKTDNPIAMYMSDFYTASANLAGVPAISLPLGLNKDNMTIGMQLQTDNFKENELIKFSKIIENDLK